MVTVTLVHAKTHLSELLDQVESGEQVIITRHGRPVANLSAIVRPKRSLQSRAAFRARIPPWPKSSAELLREMRDEER